MPAGSIAPKELGELFRKLLENALPGIKGYAWPVRAVVVKQHTEAGKVDAFHKRYSVDVQVLAKDGTLSDDAPVISDVELSPLWAGGNTAILAIPPKGAVVRVGFYYWDPSQPYVDAVLAHGYEIPAAADAKLIIQKGDVRLVIEEGKVLIDGAETTIRKNETEVVVDDAGVTIEGATIKLGAGANTQAVRFTELLAWLNSHVHLVQAVGTAPPIPPISTAIPATPATPALASQKVTLE
jgi:hypothetical protein